MLKHHPTIYLLTLSATALCLMSGCSTVSDTLSAVDYACVDIEVAPAYTDSGILGRGIILPDGEALTAETVDRLCNY
jgi:hypothetical protein